MTDHGSISLDSNFYFKFIVAWTCYSSISWWLLVASNQGRFLKLQVLLHFSKTFLSFLSGFLEFPTFTPNFLIGSQLRTIFYLIFTWSARSQDSTGMCVFILRIVVCVNISKTSSPCMLPATCPYIGCMWTLPTTICCPSRHRSNKKSTDKRGFGNERSTKTTGHPCLQ